MCTFHGLTWVQPYRRHLGPEAAWYTCLKLSRLSFVDSQSRRCRLGYPRHLLKADTLQKLMVSISPLASDIFPALLKHDQYNQVKLSEIVLIQVHRGHPANSSLQLFLKPSCFRDNSSVLFKFTSIAFLFLVIATVKSPISAFLILAPSIGAELESISTSFC